MTDVNPEPRLTTSMPLVGHYIDDEVKDMADALVEYVIAGGPDMALDVIDMLNNRGLTKAAHYVAVVGTELSVKAVENMDVLTDLGIDPEEVLKAMGLDDLSF